MWGGGEWEECVCVRLCVCVCTYVCVESWCGEREKEKVRMKERRRKRLTGIQLLCLLLHVYLSSLGCDLLDLLDLLSR